MVQIAGKPHTVLENLNIQDELRVGGVLVMTSTNPLGPQIPLVPTFTAVEAPDNYIVTGAESIIVATGTNAKTITLPDAFNAASFVRIKNRGTGLVTMATTSSQLIDGEAASSATLGLNESLTFAPFSGGWIRI